MATISFQTVSDLKSQIDKLTSDPDGAPGIVYAAVNKCGDLIFEHASGKVGFGKDEPMTTDNVFWIASCTKMITGIACMQLVEQGKIGLDDVDTVEKLAPELKAVQVLENGKLVPKKRGITLRMLLSHTAGFGYSFFHKGLNDYYGAVGVDELSSSWIDILNQPLVHQPGENWEYGVNIDWAGILLERITGLRLNDYFQQHIFKPLGITHINMFPTDEMKKSLAWMNARSSDGKLKLNPNGHLLRRPIVSINKTEIDQTFHAGGAGCFARPVQYTQIIAALLNDGQSPKTGERILKPETVKEMFTNQIPEMPNFARQGIYAPKPDLSNDLPELYPEPHDIPQGWGLTFFLHLRDGAVHPEGTGWWAGLPNLFWWCDRKNGIGGIVASQIIPFGDPKILGLWANVEAGIYGNLQKA